MTNESNLRYAGWKITAASALCVLVSFASLLVYTFGVFLKPLAAEFHWSREAISAAFGIAALSVAACSPFIGSLLDRFPAQRIFMPCLTIFGCAFASLSLLTPHLWHLYAVFLVLGIVGNGTAQLAYSRAISTWFQERRGAAFALLMSGGAVGAIVLPVLAQSLIDKFGWRSAFAALGGMLLLLGLPAGLQIRERPIAHDSAELPLPGVSVANALRSWIFWIMVTVLFFLSIGQNASIAHLAALLTDRGISTSTAAIAVSELGGATLLGRVLTGWLLGSLLYAACRFLPDRSRRNWNAALAQRPFRTPRSHGRRSDRRRFRRRSRRHTLPAFKIFRLEIFGTLYGLSWTAYAIAGAIGPEIMARRSMQLALIGFARASGIAHNRCGFAYAFAAALRSLA